MRILSLVSDAFGGHGGIALYNRDLLKAFCRHFSVREVACFPRVMRFKPETWPANLSFHSGGIASKVLYLSKLFSFLSRDRNFQIIHCGHLNLMPIAFLARVLCQAPVIPAIYGIDAWESNNSSLRSLLLKKSPFVISISEITKKRFLEWAPLLPQKVRLLPNAIHLELYGPGKACEQLVRQYNLFGKRVIMTMGRLASQERYKGFDEVLEVLPILLKRFPDLVYLIAGDGPDLPRLRQKADHLGVGANVVFTGLVPEEQKADHFRLASAYVMPSRGEGFGFVILEALACGIPVLASCLDGGREALRNGLLGLLVDPNKKEDLIHGIEKVLHAPCGIVPEGLKYFSYPEFEQRCHRLLDEIKFLRKIQ